MSYVLYAVTEVRDTINKCLEGKATRGAGYVEAIRYIDPTTSTVNYKPHFPVPALRTIASVDDEGVFVRVLSSGNVWRAVVAAINEDWQGDYNVAD